MKFTIRLIKYIVLILLAEKPDINVPWQQGTSDMNCRTTRHQETVVEIPDIKAELLDIEVKKPDIEAELRDMRIEIFDIEIKIPDICAEKLDMLTLECNNLDH